MGSSLRRPPTELRVAVVGEAPGADEVHRGEPFVGKSGKLIRTVLDQIGISSDEVFFTNACCFRPQDMAGTNRPPESSELNSCRSGLKEDLLGFQPERIICAGSSAAQAVLGDIGANYKITKERGRWIWSKEFNCWVMPTLHPANILRNPGSFPDFDNDLEKVTRPIVQWKPPHTLIAETESDVDYLLRQFIEPDRVKGDTNWRAVDIETDSLDPLTGKLLCLGISSNSNTSVVIPDSLLYLPDAQEKIRETLSSDQLLLVGHNCLSFDGPFLKHSLSTPLNWWMDTMLAHYIVDERKFTHGLKVLAKEWFDIHDYDAKLKKFVVDDSGFDVGYSNVPRYLLYNYQGIDTQVTYMLIEILLKKLQEENQTDLFFNFIMKAGKALGEMQLNGCRMDMNYLFKMRDEYKADIDTRKADLQTFSGIESFNVRSSKQVGELLFDKMGLPQIEGRSTSKEVMDVLAFDPKLPEEQRKVAKEIFDVRQKSQILSTNIDGIIKRVDMDQRLRAQFLIHGTVTGRLSSRDPNFQNIPKLIGPAIRNAFIATPGWVLCESDYSQLELRIAAFYSRDRKLVEQFWTGIDVHRLVASLMFHKPEPEITDFERYVAKYIDFGILYGRSAKACAGPGENTLNCEVSVAQKFIDDFLGGYPELAQWMESVKLRAVREGYTLTPFGRKRRFPFVTRETKGEIERESVNTHCQSMASDICLTSLMRLHNEAPKDECRVLLTVHDSILFEIREDVQDKWKVRIKQVMEDVPIVEGIVPLKVDQKIGQSWGALSDVQRTAHT